MSRYDYDEIKEHFGRFIETWKTKEILELDSIFLANVRCNISTAKNMSNGSQDSIFGIRDFINDFPKTDIFRAKIYNYVCKENGENAQQYAVIHCVALNFVDNQEVLDNFEFVCMISNHWIKTNNGWRIDKFKMDVAPQHGCLRSHFEKSWYLQDSAGLNKSPRLNCINGELDAPWFAIKTYNDDLSDEEKIKETMAKYAYGKDQLVFQYCYDAFSDYYGCGGKLTNLEKKIDWITSIKSKRIGDRYWVHPFKFISIEIKNNRAYASVQRPTGHKQRGKEYVWTRENYEYEYCCGKMELEFQKEDDHTWRLVYSNYYLGLYLTTPFDDSIYGD